jgi:uncharacterized Zn-finger protein
MAHGSTPHFHNAMGVKKIEVGAKEFKCVGALPPFDHPHVFLDMGDDNDIVCPYCSTHYIHNSNLDHAAAAPKEAAYKA